MWQLHNYSVTLSLNCSTRVLMMQNKSSWFLYAVPGECGGVEYNSWVSPDEGPLASEASYLLNDQRLPGIVRDKRCNLYLLGAFIHTWRQQLLLQ